MTLVRERCEPAAPSHALREAARLLPAYRGAELRERCSDHRVCARGIAAAPR